MGLFSKVNSKVTGSIQDFLDRADTAYMNAFSTRSTKIISRFLTPGCVARISRVIYSNADRYFGAPKFRKTEWILLENSGKELTFRKKVTFDSVRVGSILELGIASDYCEEWKICVEPELKVSSIRSIMEV